MNTMPVETLALRGDGTDVQVWINDEPAKTFLPTNGPVMLYHRAFLFPTSLLDVTYEHTTKKKVATGFHVVPKQMTRWRRPFKLFVHVQPGTLDQFELLPTRFIHEEYVSGPQPGRRPLLSLEQALAARVAYHTGRASIGKLAKDYATNKVTMRAVVYGEVYWYA